MSEEKRDERCETCRFARRDPHNSAIECHRMPPSWASGYGTGRWPKVDDFRAWCGEWQRMVTEDIPWA